MTVETAFTQDLIIHHLKFLIPINYAYVSISLISRNLRIINCNLITITIVIHNVVTINSTTIPSLDLLSEKEKLQKILTPIITMAIAMIHTIKSYSKNPTTQIKT